MEDYFVQRSWLVCLPPPSPFLFLVVADTLGKQFVSHLIAFEKLKKGEWQWASAVDEDWGDTDTIRPGLFGDRCDRAAFTSTTMRDLVLQRTLRAPGVWVYQLRAICSSSSTSSSSMTLFWRHSVFESGSIIQVFTTSNTLPGWRCALVRVCFLDIFPLWFTSVCICSDTQHLRLPLKSQSWNKESQLQFTQARAWLTKYS